MVDIEEVTVETVTPKSTKAQARHHAFTVDKPSEFGGRDTGPMASEYFLAALASCHITTAHKVAEKRKLDVRRIKIHGRQEIDGDFLTKIHLDVYVDSSMTDADRETVFRLTERICTISKATSVPITRSLHAWK